MGACLGKPLADGDQQGGRRKHKGRHKNAAPEEPEELVFANEKPPEKGAAEAQPQQRNGEIAEGSNAGGGEATGGGNGAGSAFGAGGGGRAGLSPFEDPRNKVFESPAMSVMGTPAIHLSNFSPAPATFDGLAGSILQQAAEKARVSRLRDDERGKQMGAAEGAAGGGNQIPVGVVVGGGGGGGFGAAAGAGSAGAGSSGGSGEGHEGKELNKKFGYARNINAKYELEHEVGRGHFGHTCAATGKKGEVKGVQCAIKVIPKANVSRAPGNSGTRSFPPSPHSPTISPHLLPSFPPLAPHFPPPSPLLPLTRAPFPPPSPLLPLTRAPFPPTFSPLFPFSSPPTDDDGDSGGGREEGGAADARAGPAGVRLPQPNLLPSCFSSPPISCTLYNSPPISCTLYNSPPISCTLYNSPPISCTLYNSPPISCTLYNSPPISCTLYNSPPISCTLYNSPPISCTLYNSPPISCTLYNSPPISCTLYNSPPISCTLYNSPPISCTLYNSPPISCTLYNSPPISCTLYNSPPISCTLYNSPPISCTLYNSPLLSSRFPLPVSSPPRPATMAHQSAFLFAPLRFPSLLHLSPPLFNPYPRLSRLSSLHNSPLPPPQPIPLNLPSVMSPRGGKYPEHEAREVMRQILNIIAFLHQQGVVHRDLKPENFLFKSRDEGSALRAIDFGLSDFVRPDQKLNDIVGSAYYIAPEVLHRAYGTEADVWSVGVIAYILLSGSRPFWARTESGIFRAVLRLEPNLIDAPWPAVSHAGRDFVHRLLTKDYRRRPTAAQALTHPWIRSSSARIPLDIAVYKSLRAFFSFSPLRRAGLKALVPTLTEDELVYLRAQFGYMDVDGDGLIDFNDLKNAMQRVATDAMRESHTIDLLKTLEPARISRMPFTDFCAAALNVFQLEALPNWPERARVAYQTFVRGGKAHVTIDELVKELGQVESMANAALLDEWTNFDGTVSFLGFTRLVHGPSRARKQRHVRAKPKPSVSPTSSGRVKHPPGVPEMKPIPEDGGEGRAAQGSGVLGQGQAGVQQHQQQQGQQQQQSHQEQVQADMHSFKPYQQQQPPQASGEGVGMDATAAVAGLGIPMFQSSQQQQQPHMGALGDGGRSGGSASGGNRLGASRLGGSGSRGEAMSGGTGGSVSEGMDAQRAVGEYGGGVVGSSHGEGESAVRQAKGVGSIPDGVMSAEEAVAAGGL
ncbi:unnamed protein product [Closterium sp. NIES-65]|nr:unnamed protein product [Closterium sp. NIES-65]